MLGDLGLHLSSDFENRFSFEAIVGTSVSST